MSLLLFQYCNSNKSGYSRSTFNTNSPNNPFAHANHDLVYYVGLSLWKLSCINHLSPVVVANILKHSLISSLSLLVNP